MGLKWSVNALKPNKKQERAVNVTLNWYSGICLANIMILGFGSGARLLLLLVS